MTILRWVIRTSGTERKLVVVGRGVLTLGLRGLHAGLEVAAGREGGHIAASQAMKRVGILIVRSSGWEVALILLAIEVLISAISQNELEEWCASNSFGKRAEKKVGSSYATAREQQLAFEKVLGAVSARVQ